MSLLTTHNVTVNVNDSGLILTYNMLVIYINFNTFKHQYTASPTPQFNTNNV